MNKDNIKTEILVKEQKVNVIRIDNKEYISLTDLAKYVNKDDPSGVIRNWMSNKNSFEFYSLWEEINNPRFNSVESHVIKLNNIAKKQMELLKNNNSFNNLEYAENKTNKQIINN